MIKKIYKLSPVWFQNVMISLYGYRLVKQRYGKTYYKALKYYKNKEYSDLNAEKIIQNKELVKLLDYAVNNSVFYQKFYDGIDISSIRSPEDLKKLPILEKEILRENILDIYTISSKDGISSFTGGTTGKSLKVLFTKSDFQIRMAYLDSFKEKHGFTVSCKKATFSGRQIVNADNNKSKIFWRYNFFYRQKLYSTFHMVMKNMPFYIKDLNKLKPDIINGFVSAIYELAKYIDTNKLKLEFVPRAIFTTSETLLPIHRDLLERVFSTKVYNQYASAEGASFVTECEYGELHYNIDTGVIEPIEGSDDNEILVTSFTTYGTPLIRYRIGDKIKFKHGVCKCGSSHPLIESIDGRKVDYLYSIEYGKVSLSHLADIIKGMPNSIKNMQFIQKSLDYIIINVVVDRDLYDKNMENSLMQEILFRFGKKTRFELVILDDLPRSKSGKFSFIVNNLSDEEKRFAESNRF